MEEDIFEINPYLEEFNQSLDRINSVLMRSKLEKLQESIAFLRRFSQNLRIGIVKSI